MDRPGVNPDNTESVLPITGHQNEITVELKALYQIVKRAMVPDSQYRWETIVHASHGWGTKCNSVAPKVIDS
jgi:hypothetical protein